KPAVTTYCESMALDLRDRGIDVTTLCPGFVDTPLTRKNNHAMPCLIDAESAARLMKKAIDQKKVLYLYPWPMKWVILFLSRIPRGLYRWLMRAKATNYSQ